MDSRCCAFTYCSQEVIKDIDCAVKTQGLCVCRLLKYLYFMKINNYGISINVDVSRSMSLSRAKRVIHP